MGRQVLEIIVARHSGLCAGVRRAVDRAVAAAVAAGRVQSLGPLIHNTDAVAWLREHGVESVDDLSEVEKAVVLPSHGVGPAVYREAEARGLTIYDTTCVDVRRTQQWAKEMADEGRQVIIIGDPHHTEVKGILAWTEGQALVVESAEQARRLPGFKRAGVVCQTTMRPEEAHRIVAILNERTKDLAVHLPACRATALRQAETRQLARSVDVLLVVGGLSSANTTQLARIGAEEGCRTYHIERAAQLEAEWLRGAHRVGIVAGASTPDGIMEEVYDKVTEIDKNQESSKVAETTMPSADIAELREGEIIRGRIVAIGDEVVMVNIGYKSDGIITKEELGRGEIVAPGHDLQIGQEIEVYIVRLEGEDGHPLLSKRRAEEVRQWELLKESLETGKVIEAKVTKVVRGGLMVEVGFRGFVPASHVDIGRVENLEQFIGETFRLVVIELDEERRRAVLSRRRVLETERALERERIWETLKAGDVKDGVVRRLTGFGAFVDIGGVDGLVHVSEMGWQRVEHPGDVVKEGDRVKVKVLKVDQENGRISLSMRELMEDPWEEAARKFSVGSVVTGKVMRIAPFGAFVELAEGIEGLVHVSQLAKERVEKPGEVVTEGQEVKVKILDIRPADHRIALSIKQAAEEADRANYRAYMADQKKRESVTLGDMFGDLLEQAKKESKEEKE
ncbi:MAG: bifunctional 4-hydroxy-3-methylbut-2-enyl diphosphate reductase/30S ribosomal protein S1 [Bacillota bacterium]